MTDKPLAVPPGDEMMRELKIQTALLQTIAGQLERLAQSQAPLNPNYRRHLSEYAGFDFPGEIGAIPIALDPSGPTELQWNGHRWTRRRSKGEDDTFGEAIWYSRPGESQGQYYILIKFADYKAKRIGDELAGSIEAKAQTQRPALSVVKPGPVPARPVRQEAAAPPVAAVKPAPAPPAAPAPLRALPGVAGNARQLFNAAARAAVNSRQITGQQFNEITDRHRDNWAEALAELESLLAVAV